VGNLKRPSEFKNAPRVGLDRTQNLKSLVFPIEMPAQNSRDDDDEKSIGEVSNTRKSLFQTALELATGIKMSAIAIRKRTK
jgi:hypothetical protein